MAMPGRDFEEVEAIARPNTESHDHEDVGTSVANTEPSVPIWDASYDGLEGGVVDEEEVSDQ